jgi:hypothetical protein
MIWVSWAGEGTRDWALGTGEEGEGEGEPDAACAASHVGGCGWVGAGWEGAGCMGARKSGVLYRGAKDTSCAQEDGLCARRGLVEWGLWRAEMA